jgi:hypothetical protein
MNLNDSIFRVFIELLLRKDEIPLTDAEQKLAALTQGKL